MALLLRNSGRLKVDNQGVVLKIRCHLKFSRQRECKRIKTPFLLDLTLLSWLVHVPFVEGFFIGHDGHETSTSQLQPRLCPTQAGTTLGQIVLANSGKGTSVVDYRFFHGLWYANIQMTGKTSHNVYIVIVLCDSVYICVHIYIYIHTYM